MYVHIFTQYIIHIIIMYIHIYIILCTYVRTYMYMVLKWHKSEMVSPPHPVKPEVVSTKRSLKDRLSPSFPEFSGSVEREGGGRRRVREGRGGKPRPSAESKAIFEAYASIESGTKKDMSHPITVL